MVLQLAERRQGKERLSPTIFDTMVSPDLESDQTVSVEDLSAEAFALVLAGTESTATTLIQGTFRVLNDKKIYGKLREEIFAVMPSRRVLPPLEDLRHLPYLVCSSFKCLSNSADGP